MLVSRVACVSKRWGGGTKQENEKLVCFRNVFKWLIKIHKCLPACFSVSMIKIKCYVP